MLKIHNCTPKSILKTSIDKNANIVGETIIKPLRCRDETYYSLLFTRASHFASSLRKYNEDEKDRPMRREKEGERDKRYEKRHGARSQVDAVVFAR